MIDSSDALGWGQRAAQLAHDIRNPLHAIRLNLHTLRLSLQCQGRLSANELEMLFTESDTEIDRIERRMREFLDSPSPGTAHEE
jgi:nitrogen fixation/metabolism regulation signal transduction histidine kinase